LMRARREASSRPLSLANRVLDIGRSMVSLLSYGALLLAFSPWAVAILVLSGLPPFVAEARFSTEGFKRARWRSPQVRMQAYLETVVANDHHAKEVKLFDLGPLFLGRYKALFHEIYDEERALAKKRHGWTLALGLIGTIAYYGAYAWIAAVAVMGRITL